MSDEHNSHKNNKLCLKTVYELLGENFYIPAYQRGYRWTKDQVDDLLNDIWAFSQSTDANNASFYCLQPVVVVQDGEQWQVVDGQQRLTTLYIILHYLEKQHLRRDLSEAYKKPVYTLEYETRTSSAEFLKNILPPEQVNNIDFYHIAQAYEAVKRWFGEFEYDEYDDFMKTLLGKAHKAKSVQVIWYDLSDECTDSDYAIDVFSRINIGKIPLTNAELIKALFLQQHDVNESHASVKQIQIASEWDAIEKSLQNSELWYFISNSKLSNSYATRIEFIFDLMMEKPKGEEKLYTFHKFNQLFNPSKDDDQVDVVQVDVDKIWKSVKDYFLTFNQWFEDRELYHLIGFLVDSGSSIVEIKKQSELKGSTKTEFKAYLKNEIKKKVKVDIDTLEYGDKAIKSILLLFNIQTLLATNEADVRFPFDRYKTESWDIEHIRSQTDKDINGNNRNLWLEDVLEYFTDSRNPLNQDLKHIGENNDELVAEVRQLLLADKFDDAVFKQLYTKVATVFHEQSGEAWVDGLGNLALLDATTNRSYGNAMFPIKRKRIIANDMNGVFVPICTKNVFLKYYSKKMADVMYWKASDANDYLAAIKHTLIEYLPKQDASHE